MAADCTAARGRAARRFPRRELSAGAARRRLPAMSDSPIHTTQSAPEGSRERSRRSSATSASSRTSRRRSPARRPRCRASWRCRRRCAAAGLTRARARGRRAHRQPRERMPRTRWPPTRRSPRGAGGRRELVAALRAGERARRRPARGAARVHRAAAARARPRRRRRAARGRLPSENALEVDHAGRLHDVRQPRRPTSPARRSTRRSRRRPGARWLRERGEPGRRPRRGPASRRTIALRSPCDSQRPRRRPVPRRHAGGRWPAATSQQGAPVGPS